MIDIEAAIHQCPHCDGLCARDEAALHTCVECGQRHLYDMVDSLEVEPQEPTSERWLLNQPDHTTASIRETAVMRAVHAATCPTPPTERTPK